MTPEGWTLVTAVAVAVVGGGAGVRSAGIARQAQRDAATSAPYEALAKRVVDLEARAQTQDARIEALEGEVDLTKTELRTEREKSAHMAAAFRSRIQVLLRHIAALDEYAEVLVDIIRTKVTTVSTMPKKPELPPDAADEL